MPLESRKGCIEITFLPMELISSKPLSTLSLDVMGVVIRYFH
jgi:hypothetical protein